MKVLHFLFLLGVCFTIFEFLWGLFKILFNFLTGSIQSAIKTNSIRIIKYILFTAVAIQFVHIVNTDSGLINNQGVSITLGALLIFFYLIGKYQNRAAYTQIKGIANQFMKGFMPVFDSKLEIALILGAVGFFVLGSFYPLSTANGITNWFTDAILNIYNTPFFGFIFKLIAFFVLINTLSRAAKIIGKLLSGNSFSEATKSENPFINRFNTQGFNHARNQNTISEEPEFTDYEEVTDDEPTEK